MRYKLISNIAIVTYANLGDKANLKTPDIQPVIDLFSRHGFLKQVICQIHKNVIFSYVYSAIPWFVWYPLRSLEKWFGVQISRKLMENLFDSFTSRKLTQADIYILHGGSSLPHTFRKARSHKGIVIDLTTMAHPKINAHLEKQEMERLNLSNTYNTFAKIVESSKHRNSFDYIIAISDFVKQTYIQSGYPAEKIFLAEPDIDIKRFHPSQKEDDVFRVVYVAYTTPLKGLHYLLEAWERLNLHNAELVLVGGYADIPDTLKERYDLIVARNKNIRQVGSTQSPEDYYKNASLMVFPSLTEGFGRVTLEAMASGIPVVTTENARGIVEDGKTGFVVPIRDAEAIAEKIQYLYDHRDILKEMGKEARKAVENKKPFGKAVYEIYEEILKKENTFSSQKSMEIL